MSDFLLQHQLHQLLSGRGHILEPLSERNNREAHAFQVLHHLHSTPAVEGNLPNVETLTQAFDKFLNVAVVNDIALGGLQISLPLPHIVWHMVTPDSQVEVVLRYPEVRQDDVLVILIFWRKHQNERRNVRCGRKVQTAVADATFQIILVDGELAFVPLVHRHPANCLFDPLVESQLSEGVLLAGVLLCRLAGVFDLVDANRDAERGIGFLPDLRVRPIVRFLRTVDDGIEGVVDASYFAFTATPKNKTLETFGVPYQDGDDIKHRPFHVYTMKQAIQEGFILDVLQYYTPIDSFYKLMKTVEDDPMFDKKRAQKKLRSFVESDSYTIAKKAAMMVDHFHEQVIAKGKIGGQARAMVVTSSIPRCIEYYYAINKCLADRHSPYKTIIAFSGENKYQGQEPPLTSAGLNGFPDAKIPKEFKKDPYRILIVADMFQTGFDEPLLHTMYVDKVLYDIKAVQTLSRLNRCCPKKYDTFVLDFANKPEMIQESFSRYYRTTILSGETDPNKLYDLVATMEEYQVFSNEDVERLVNLYLDGADRDKLDPTLDACTAVYKQFDTDDQIKFKSAAKAFVRTYGFLGAILPYGNADWERLSIFLNLLIPKLPSPREDDLSQGILETIDLESYRNEAREVMSIRLEDTDTEVAPVPAGKVGHIVEPEMDLLSVILSNFNDMFGNINWNDADNVRRQILEIPAMVSKDEKYQNAMRNSDEQSARLESERALQQVIFSIMADNMELFKQFQDNPSFKKWLSDLVFNLTYNKDGKPYEAPNSDIASKEN